MRDLEEDNAKLKESLAARDLELSEVREQLASLSRGAGEESCAERASESAVHEGKHDPPFSPHAFRVPRTLHGNNQRLFKKVLRSTISPSRSSQCKQSWASIARLKFSDRCSHKPSRRILEA